MTDEKKADERRALLVRVPVDPPLPPKIHGFHQQAVSVEPQEATGGRRVDISSGIGIGNNWVHVAVDGKRVLTVELTELFESVVGEALRMVEEEAGIAPPPTRPDRREECVFGSSADRLAVARDRVNCLERLVLWDGDPEDQKEIHAIAAELGLIESILRANNGGGR